METFERWESEIRGYCRLYPSVFDTAKNAKLVDENGKAVIDFFAGAGVLNFGHNNDRMKKAMIAFLERDGVAHSLDMYTTAKRDFVAGFAKTILEPRGMDYKMQFMGPTGTNAVEAALKLARISTGRRTVVAFTHGFHGMTLGSLACTANEHFRNAAGVPLENVVRHSFGCDTPCVGCKLNCGMGSLGALRAMYDDAASGLEKPAAFVVEAIQAEGGVRVASAEWLKGVQQLAHDLGALFIIDDIQAGCGRTGKYFSFEDMGLDPDIITLAKGIGGFGTPMAMNLNKPEHDKHWVPGQHTGTFRGQGLSFVAGKEALSYFEDDSFLAEVRGKGEKMRGKLESIVSDAGKDWQVRGKGMMQAIDYRDGAIAKQILTQCFEEGLLIGACGAGGKVLKLIPPLTIPDDELDEGMNILAKATAAAVA